VRFYADGAGARILDQRELPWTVKWVELRSARAAEQAIREMWTRGAPLIGATAAYGLAMALAEDGSDSALDAAYALLLDSPYLARGRAFFKLAVFLPVVTPDVAGYVVWRWLYDQSFGAVNAALKGLGLPLFGGIAAPQTAMLAVLLAELWHHCGFYVVIFLANLAVCERALSEAQVQDRFLRNTAHLSSASQAQVWLHAFLNLEKTSNFLNLGDLA
jgi:hypothetical protein